MVVLVVIVVVDEVEVLSIFLVVWGGIVEGYVEFIVLGFFVVFCCGGGCYVGLGFVGVDELGLI